MVDRLLSTLPRRCFVIMPYGAAHEPLFKKAIRPAVKEVGDQPVHLGFLDLHGNVVKQIDEGIKNSEYVIAVLDGLRLNVFSSWVWLTGRGRQRSS